MMRRLLGKIDIILGVALCVLIVATTSADPTDDSDEDPFEKLAQLLEEKCPSSVNLGSNLASAQKLLEDLEKEYSKKDAASSSLERMDSPTKRPSIFGCFAKKKEKIAREQSQKNQREIEAHELSKPKINLLKWAIRQFIEFATFEARNMCTEYEREKVDSFSESVRRFRRADNQNINRIDLLIAGREAVMDKPECKLASDLKVKYRSLDARQILKVQIVANAVYHKIWTIKLGFSFLGNIYNNCIKPQQLWSNFWPQSASQVAVETVNNLVDISDAKGEVGIRKLEVDLIRPCQYYINSMSDIFEQADSNHLWPGWGGEPRISVRDLYETWCRFEMCKAMIGMGAFKLIREAES